MHCQYPFLQDSMQQPGYSSSAISSASRQIAGGNPELSSRTEERSASIVETVASMEQLISTVGKMRRMRCRRTGCYTDFRRGDSEGFSGQ